MLKRIAFAVLVLTVLASVACGGESYVKGHTTKNGTYVPGHYRSSPDKSFSNNWSTKGNTNPHTGKAGTLAKPPAKSKSKK